MNLYWIMWGILVEIHVFSKNLRKNSCFSLIQNSGGLEDTRKKTFGNSWLWFSIHSNEMDTFSSTHNVPDAGNFLMHNYWIEEKCSALLWSRLWIIHPELRGYITIFKRNIQTIISLWPSFTYTLEKVLQTDAVGETL